MNRRKILLVDDEAIIVKTLASRLSEEGFAVTSARDGHEALAHQAKTTFDLVITDLMMEGLDGIQVLKESKRRSPQTSVIILTGYGDLTSAVDALRLGADDYLLKPCDNNELLFRISRCFEKQELQKTIRMYEDILPICLVCKKIRDDSGKEPGTGEWVPVDKYLTCRAGKNMSHGYCPDCGQKFLEQIDSQFNE